MGLIANIESQTSGSAPGTFADVPALNTGSITIASLASILFLMASVPIIAASDRAAEFRFTVDGVQEGPFGRIQTDATDEGDDLASLAWVITGLSGSHTFALQWKDAGAPSVPDLDTTRVRNLQVVEIP